MKATTRAERFKILGARTPIPVAAAATAGEATRAAEGIPAAEVIPEEAATQGADIPGVAVTALTAKTATAGGTRRLTKGWRA
jgi:hypothetical protein